MSYLLQNLPHHCTGVEVTSSQCHFCDSLSTSCTKLQAGPRIVSAMKKTTHLVIQAP